MNQPAPPAAPLDLGRYPLKEAQRRFQEEEKILQALIRLIESRAYTAQHLLPWSTPAAARMFQKDLQKATAGLGDAITECGHALAEISRKTLDAKLAEDRAFIEKARADARKAHAGDQR